MTLRGRLTAAFLAVVLGPVLLGSLFVGSTLTTVERDRSVNRLNLAASTVQTSLGALCRQLRAVADAVAVVADPTARAAVADHVVRGGLASAVTVTDAAGNVAFRTTDAPAEPWLNCAAGPGESGSSPRALAAVVRLRDPTGVVLGTVTAAQVVDAAFITRLAAAAGAEVTLLTAGSPPVVVHSTEPDHLRTAIVAAALRLRDGSVVRADGGRYVRWVDPASDQPLSLVLSVPDNRAPGSYALLIAAVGLAGLFGVLAAWRLARATTRPLAELADAVERVSRGDLATRVPVRRRDEVGQLAGAFNRMTREIESYVQALTASRNQLRGHVAILGDTLSSTHDLKRILQLILRTALAATSARTGVVLLLDPASGRLVDPFSDIEVTVGSGLLGSVAATGEPRRGRLDRDQPEPVPGEPQGDTYIAVPIALLDPTEGRFGSEPVDGGDSPTGPPPVLGVLAVYDRLGSTEFDDGDLATLRTFAAQAAVAVDNVRAHDEMQRLSLTDPLTGLGNYRNLRMSVRREIKRAARADRRLAVLALDLDWFKEVNDTHGHAAGDQVLAEFARRVRSVVREVDLAFRYGGEEFVVLLPDTDARGGVVVADRLGAAIRDTPVLVRSVTGSATDSAPVTVTVSIGIAIYPEHGATAQSLLHAADEALYSAKAAGRDTYRVAGDAAGTGPAAAVPSPEAAATPATAPVEPAATSAASTERRARVTEPLPAPAAEPPADRVGVITEPDAGPDGASSPAPPPRQARGR